MGAPDRMCDCSDILRHAVRVTVTDEQGLHSAEIGVGFNPIVTT